MGMQDSFNNNEQNPFGLFPDMADYRIYLLLKGGEANEIQAQMDEYDKIYSNETPFLTEMYKVDGTPWTYFVLTLRTDVAEPYPVWSYFDILLWMREKVNLAFAYACPKQQGYLPIVACCEENNPSHDSCAGIANGRNFRAVMPDWEVIWGQNVPIDFNYIGYIRETYGIDVSQL